MALSPLVRIAYAALVVLIIMCFAAICHAQGRYVDGWQCGQVVARVATLEERVLALETRQQPSKRSYILMHSSAGCSACQRWSQQEYPKIKKALGWKAAKRTETGPGVYPWFELWDESGRRYRHDSYLTLTDLQTLLK